MSRAITLNLSSVPMARYYQNHGETKTEELVGPVSDDCRE